MQKESSYEATYRLIVPSPQKNGDQNQNYATFFKLQRLRIDQLKKQLSCQSKQEQVSSVYSIQAERNSSSQNSQSRRKLDQQSQRKKSSSQTKPRKGPYKKYGIEIKLLAIELINSGKDVQAVSMQFNIPRRNLMRWKKNGCRRKQGCGRQSDLVMQQKLFDMILKKELNSQKQIREYALTQTNVPNFKASKGWYVKFMRRFNQYKQKRSKQGKEEEEQIIWLQKD